MKTPTDAKVSIQFPITFREEHAGARYGIFNDSKLQGIEYGSEGQIKAKLKARAEAQIAEALLDQKHHEGWVIGCGDGSMYVISFRGGQWQTAHYGPTQRGGCYTIGGKDLDSVVESTRKHVADVFGGVAWESSL